MAGSSEWSMAEPQTYQLYIHLCRSVTIRVGALGSHRFPAGDYIYTGSARRNIEARVRRHCSDTKKLRWHIDYLLHTSAASVVGVELSTEPECQLNQSTGGDVLVPGFGASDCRAGCGSHLKYLRGLRRSFQSCAAVGIGGR